MIKLIQIFFGLFLGCLSVQAGTVVQIEKDNEITTLITDGSRVRMNTSPAEYVILDSRDNSLRLVDAEKQTVTLVDVNSLAAEGNPAKVRATIHPQGEGQVVAGYATRKYSYAVNGRQCGVLHASKNAYETDGIKQLLTAMDIMMDKQRAALGGFASLVDACTLADMQLADYVSIIGLPMRTDKQDGVDFEVRSIRTGIVLAEEVFAIPASFTMVSSSGARVSVVKTPSPPVQKQHHRVAAPGAQPVIQSSPHHAEPAGRCRRLNECYP